MINNCLIQSIYYPAARTTPCNLFVTIPAISLSYLKIIVQELMNLTPIPDLNLQNKGNAPVIQGQPRSGSHGNLQKN